MEEINEAEEWLKEILHFNTIPKLAAIVEHHLTRLKICSQKFDDLNDDTLSLELKLSKDIIPIGNKMITEDIKKQQNELRSNIYKAEKEFLEAKYNCNDFLADAITVQGKMQDEEN